MPNSVGNSSLVNDTYSAAEWADGFIEELLEWVNWTVNGGAQPGSNEYGISGTTVDGVNKININRKYSGVDPMSGAGALIIDRIMSELSNLEAIAANALATEQKIAQATNSKLSS
jgi:hypothetical protein